VLQIRFVRKTFISSAGQLRCPRLWRLTADKKHSFNNRLTRIIAAKRHEKTARKMRKRNGGPDLTDLKKENEGQEAEFRFIGI
jgi:hypothetical protein